MNLPYSISMRLPLEEFRKMAEKHSRKIKIANTTLGSAYEIFHGDPEPFCERCEFLIHSILILGETIQAFTSLLSITYLPYSVCELRSPLLNTLYFIHKQGQETVLQLLSFKDIRHTTSECSLLQQLKIQRKIEVILQESQDVTIDIELLLDQTRFLENYLGSQKKYQPRTAVLQKLVVDCDKQLIHLHIPFRQPLQTDGR